MHITELGYILIPIGILLLLIRPYWLFGLVGVAAIFQAAAVMTLGSSTSSSEALPLTPYYFVLLLLLIAFAQSTLRHFLHRLKSDRRYQLLFLLLLWAGLSSALLPHLFTGLPVFSPRAGLGTPLLSLTPLHLQISNIAQTIYLFLNIYFLICMESSFNRADVIAIMFKGIYIGLGLVLLIGFTMKFMPGEIVHIHGLLYSNLAASQTYTYMVYHNRIYSTFTEPSMLACYIAAICCSFAARIAFASRLTTLPLIALIASCLVLLWTGSTTGYVAFLSGLFLLFLAVVVWPLLHGRIRMSSLVVFGLLFLFGVISYIFLPAAIQRYYFYRNFLHKNRTLSAEYRFIADRYTLHIFSSTYGLGAGLGSDRPSSFLTYLLANLGLPGVVLIAALLGYTLYLVYQYYQAGGAGHNGLAMTFWGFTANLFGMLAALPDLNWSFLWIWWALLGAICMASQAPRAPVLSASGMQTRLLTAAPA